MEGGLDYLKDVVIHDSLGIASELERRMSHVVGTYQDEWRTAVENPEVRKRFVTFINAKVAEQNDPHVQFAEVRGQIRPKTEAERDVTRIPVVEA